MPFSSEMRTFVAPDPTTSALPSAFRSAASVIGNEPVAPAFVMKPWPVEATPFISVTRPCVLPTPREIRSALPSPLASATSVTRNTLLPFETKPCDVLVTPFIRLTRVLPLPFSTRSSLPSLFRSPQPASVNVPPPFETKPVVVAVLPSSSWIRMLVAPFDAMSALPSPLKSHP